MELDVGVGKKGERADEAKVNTGFQGWLSREAASLRRRRPRCEP